MNMNRMNLAQLVEFLKEAELPVTANYFNGCAKDRVTVDGLIEYEFVKRHIGEGMLLRSIQANVTTYVDFEDCEEFKFTFETDADQFAAERTGYIDEYDCVRMEVKHTEGGSIDFPIKNREEYNRALEIHNGYIVKVYPTVHSYDAQDYL
jgi:hypothetical protein